MSAFKPVYVACKSRGLEVVQPDDYTVKAMKKLFI